MNHLVKIKESWDGESRRKEDQKWCLVVTSCGDSATFCQGEYFGLGSGCREYDEKTVKRGGITCPDCLEQIREIKAVKL